jgi:hypothetical protein
MLAQQSAAAPGLSGAPFRRGPTPQEQPAPTPPPPPPPPALEAAEQALHDGKWQQARGAAGEALAGAGAAPADLTRALYVVLQADFQTGRLTDLEETARAAGRPLESIPVAPMLLW